ncbi:MAG: peptidylprolyl isomerase [Paenibacillaceae bacterium]
MLLNNKKSGARWLIMLVMVMAVTMLSACSKGKSEAGASSSPSAAPAPSHQPDEVAAVYKGGQVTYGELDSYVHTSTFLYPQQAIGQDEKTLQQLVVFKVIGERTSEENKKAAETRVKQQVDSFKTYYDENKAAMDSSLKAANIELKDIEAYFHTIIYAVQDMTSKVTDQQIKADYDAKIKVDKDTFTTATVDQILIATKDLTDQTGKKNVRTDEEALKRAQDVKAKWENGGDLTALAKEYSDDPGSKDKAGRYENVKLTEWVMEFKKAAAEFPINIIGEPVKTAYGYHVLKVIDRKVSGVDDVNVKEDIRSELANGLFNDFMINEFPKLDFKSNIPTPTPASTSAPSTEASPTGAPAK